MEKKDKTKKSGKLLPQFGADRKVKKKPKAKKSPIMQDGKVRFIRLDLNKLKKGGTQIKYYSKSAVNSFNDFTSGKHDAKFDQIVDKYFPWVRRIKFSMFVVGSVILLLAMIFLFNNASIVLDEKTLSIAGLPDAFEGYRIVLLSDMHGHEFGDDQASLLRTLNGVRYDMMIMAGDMVGRKGNAAPLYHLIDGLTSTAPIYFIAGDSDPGPLVDEPRDVVGTLEEFVLEDWILGAIDHGAVYIDAPIGVQRGNSTLWLSPEPMLETEASALLSLLNAQYRLETAEVIEGGTAARTALPLTAWRVQCAEKLLDAVGKMKTEDLHIAVGHFPTFGTYNTEGNYSDSTMLRMPDLVLTGHYCGGGWRIPGVGALYVPAEEAPRHGWFPDQSIVEGERMLGNVSLYTTGGLSVTDKLVIPKFRLFNQPKVTVLTLTAALTDDLLGINN